MTFDCLQLAREPERWGRQSSPPGVFLGSLASQATKLCQTLRPQGINEKSTGESKDRDITIAKWKRTCPSKQAFLETKIWSGSYSDFQSYVCATSFTFFAAAKYGTVLYQGA